MLKIAELYNIISSPAQVRHHTKTSHAASNKKGTALTHYVNAVSFYSVNFCCFSDSTEDSD